MADLTVMNLHPRTIPTGNPVTFSVTGSDFAAVAAVTVTVVEKSASIVWTPTAISNSTPIVLTFSATPTGHGRGPGKLNVTVENHTRAGRPSASATFDVNYT
jgi:hypothetical protein